MPEDRDPQIGWTSRPVNNLGRIRGTARVQSKHGRARHFMDQMSRIIRIHRDSRNRIATNLCHVMRLYAAVPEIQESEDCGEAFLSIPSEALIV